MRLMSGILALASTASVTALGLVMGDRYGDNDCSSINANPLRTLHEGECVELKKTGSFNIRYPQWVCYIYNDHGCKGDASIYSSATSACHDTSSATWQDAKSFQCAIRD